jgi:hypothetical protein
MNRCRWIAALPEFSGAVAVPRILAGIHSADRVDATVCGRGPARLGEWVRQYR